MPEQPKTSWQIACDWYKVDDIERSIQHGKDLWRDPSLAQIVPKDVYSKEFAVWLTDQYRLAMNKGMQLAQEAKVSADLEAAGIDMQPANERLRKMVDEARAKTKTPGQIAYEAYQRVVAPQTQIETPDYRALREPLPAAWEASADAVLDGTDDFVKSLTGPLHREIATLKEELALWKPMTPEEAEAAFEAAVPVPISDEEIDAIVAKVTDPAYRPTEPECVLLAAKVEQLTRERNIERALHEELREAHHAGFREAYRILGIEDDGEYRWKWLLLELSKQQPWIPVAERLPEPRSEFLGHQDSHSVLVVGRHRNDNQPTVFVDRFCASGKWGCQLVDEQEWTITHWMPKSALLALVPTTEATQHG